MSTKMPLQSNDSLFCRAESNSLQHVNRAVGQLFCSLPTLPSALKKTSYDTFPVPISKS